MNRKVLVQHIIQLIEQDMFNFKIPKEFKSFLEQLKNLKIVQSPQQKYETLKITENEFIRHMVSDQVLGPVGL